MHSVCPNCPLTHLYHLLCSVSESADLVCNLAPGVNATMSGLYRSMPLHFGDSTNIRVLEVLHDATYRPAAPILCKVQVITLEDDRRSDCESQIPYNALSYT
jgi:hypothetical protein